MARRDLFSPWGLGMCLCIGVATVVMAQGIATSTELLEKAKRAVRVKDFVTAMSVYQTMAEQGDLDAFYQIGALYQTGRGVPQDNTLAFRWFLKAAQKGHAKAQYSLGTMFENGLGTTQDYQAAMEWYERSAALQYPPALEKTAKAKKGGMISSRNMTLSREELLLSAIRDQHSNDIAQLLSFPVNVNYQDHFGRSALMEAAVRGELDVVQMLLARGVNVDVAANDGDNALLLAIGKKQTGIIKGLLEAKANVNVQDAAGMTPLMIAVQRDDVDLAKLLISYKADVAKTNASGQNALKIALLKGADVMTKVLLSTGQVTLPVEGKSPEALKAAALKLKDEKWPPLIIAGSSVRRCILITASPGPLILRSRAALNGSPKRPPAPINALRKVSSPPVIASVFKGH